MPASFSAPGDEGQLDRGEDKALQLIGCDRHRSGERTRMGLKSLLKHHELLTNMKRASFGQRLANLPRLGALRRTNRLAATAGNPQPLLRRKLSGDAFHGAGGLLFWHDLLLLEKDHPGHGLSAAGLLLHDAGTLAVLATGAVAFANSWTAAHPVCAAADQSLLAFGKLGHGMADRSVEYNAFHQLIPKKICGDGQTATPASQRRRPAGP